MQKRFMYAFWVIVFILITYIAHSYLQYKENTALTPFIEKSKSEKIVTLRAYNHHYMSYGTINDLKVKFLIDTGATSVSIPEEIAKKVGLKKGLGYTVSTANGNITVYQTYVKTLTIGNIVLNDVRASINPSSDDDFILLGMSALRQLEMIQKDNTLILKQNLANSHTW
ncbi:retropepsin-like aspartic protease family protein [Fastidiosibacter lacustris]|uniref:retropepsin-like aspartic protease family protein n=1 Tax=Fastidiosibacter lacustris TaxID=2056695 RepID=UPI000E3527DB|nr:retropepsin-like aspartic protease [Fastidiosibacter lacustris]